MPRGQAAALKALEIDPGLAEAHATLGLIASTYEFDWKRGDEYFQRALSTNPNYAIAHLWYAMFNLMATGRLKEALAELSIARDLDPLNPACTTMIGTVLLAQRDYAGAVRELRRTVEFDPNFPPGRFWFAEALEASGQAEAAEQNFKTAIQLLDESPIYLGRLGYHYATRGDQSGARAILARLDELVPKRYVAAMSYALVHIGLRDFDKAFEYLERAWDERSSLLLWMINMPYGDSIRDDPRYHHLLTRMGLL
jgi:tetratricopeptide (TPR) repeat protein